MIIVYTYQQISDYPSVLCQNFWYTNLMKLAIILSTNNVETNWNALRFANLALKKGDEVSIFLLGEGVEYDQLSSQKFDVKAQVETVS